MASEVKECLQDHANYTKPESMERDLVNGICDDFDAILAKHLGDV